MNQALKEQRLTDDRTMKYVNYPVDAAEATKDSTIRFKQTFEPGVYGSCGLCRTVEQNFFDSTFVSIQEGVV